MKTDLSVYVLLCVCLIRCHAQSFSGQIRLFFSSLDDDTSERLVLRSASRDIIAPLDQDLGRLFSFLNELTSPEDFNDDDTEKIFKGCGGQPHGFILFRTLFPQAPHPAPSALPCTADVQTYCQQVAATAVSPFSVRMCLRGKATELSDSCTQALAETPTVVEVCYPDIHQHCSSVSPGNSKVHSCLSRVGHGLSSSCRGYFNSMGLSVAANPSVENHSVMDRIMSLKAVILDQTEQVTKAFQPTLHKAKVWVEQHNSASGGLALFLVAVFVLISLSEKRRQQHEREEFMAAGGYELMLDEEDVYI
jgi:hypothetical protein